MQNVRKQWSMNALALIGLITIFLITGLLNTLTSYYHKEAKVIDTYNNIVVVEDINGNQWEIEANGFNTKDKVVIKLYDNHTDSYIYDDEIVNIKISTM